MTAHSIDALVREAETGSQAETDPEASILAVVKVFHANLGDRMAHQKPDALAPGQSQFFVGGAFMVTPDRAKLVLVGNVGFPADQKRLLVPIDGGNPGQVIATARPLLLEDTTTRQDFRQYLSTSRMSSAIYAPLTHAGSTFGLIIMAAQARWTFGQADLEALVALAPATVASWLRCQGDNWLAVEYLGLKRKCAERSR